MEALITLAQIEEAARAIKSRLTLAPTTAIILGSGLGELAGAVENPEVIPYGLIPHWPVSTVIGHQGRLVVGMLENQAVVVMQGRVHYYEGYSMSQVTMPVRVLRRLGVQNLLVTNAAGAINPNYAPGDLMLISDHINMVGMAGQSPLRGPNLEEFGPRFPDMSQAYNRKFLNLARQAAQQNSITLHEGIYICLAGPSFETPADLRFLRAIGADAVGMSTVPEVTIARHCGMDVLGISGISNKANLDGNTITSHIEVLEAGQVLTPRLLAVIRGFLRLM
jgi:purine-nucleoside phosphorylase